MKYIYIYIYDNKIGILIIIDKEENNILRHRNIKLSMKKTHTVEPAKYEYAYNEIWLYS